MQINCGHIKSKAQFCYREFSSESASKSEIMDISELNNTDLDCIFFEGQIPEEIQEYLNKESVFIPIVDSAKFDLNIEKFENIEFNVFKSKFLEIHEKWILANNLVLLKEIFKVAEHLKALWPNNRNEFFEEFWFTIKSNLGASKLQLIYNTISQEEDKDKKKLIQVSVTGSRVPESQVGGEIEKDLLENYNKNSEIFDICEYDREKGELVAIARINNSPVLILANILQLTAMQKTLIYALLTGIQDL